MEGAEPRLTWKSTAGILLLVLFHALDDQITANLFSDYYPTIKISIDYKSRFGYFDG